MKARNGAAIARRLLGRARRSVIIRAFGTVSAGTAGGQAIAFLVIPLLSRWYGASEFGELGVFVATSAILAIVSSLRLDMAVPLGRDESEAGAIASTGVVVSMIVGVIMMPLFAMGEASWLVLGRTASALLPVSAVLGAWWLVLNQLAVRAGHFRAIAVRALVQPVVAFLVQGVWIFADLHGPGLVVGYVVGQVAAVLLYMLDVGRLLVFSRRVLCGMLTKYWHYVLVMAPQGAVNAIGTQLPLLIVSWLYGRDTVGLFSMTQKVMGVPVALVGTAMGQVYLSFLSSAVHGRTGEARRLFRRVSSILGSVAVALAAAVILGAPQAFTLFLGGEWAVSGRIAQVMAVAFAAQMIGAPLSATLIVARQERRLLLWDIGRVVALCCCLGCGYVFGLGILPFSTLVAAVVAGAYGILWMASKRAVEEISG